VLTAGDRLAEILFPAQARELLAASLLLARERKAILRIRLVLKGPLQDVPWEYAVLNAGGAEATPADFLALAPDISIVRDQADQIPPQAIEAELPARLLVALASPFGLAPLDLERERQAIAGAIEGNAHVQATWKLKATPDSLLEDVGRAHLFHFAGHGETRPAPQGAPQAAEEGVLAFEDGSDDPQEVRAGELAVLLRSAGVRVAALGACESGRQSGVNQWSSSAAALLKGGLHAVVGMQFKIRAAGARAFFAEFYDRLVSGLAIDEAAAAGRIKASLGDPAAWGAPVVYLRAEDGVVFPANAANPSLEPARQQQRLTIRQDIGILLGQVTGIEVKTIRGGQASVDQTVRTVEKGATLVGGKVGTIEGGSLDINQKVDENKGDITGLTLDSLG
jgi:hypothetical protein